MSSKAILLVEDNADDVELTLRAFSRSTIHPQIHVARDGSEALAALIGSEMQPQAATLPALVLLDLKLPGLSGFDVLRVLRANVRTRMLPVTILTSSTEPIDLVTGYGLGANSYIRKPGSFAELLTVTHQIATYWLQLNETPTQR
jgi:two-component system, response regulator